MDLLSRALGFPITSLKHCESPELDKFVIQWCQYHDLISPQKLGHIQEIQCGTLAHITLSKASFEMQAIGSIIIAWLFLFDDEYADGSLRYKPDELSYVIEKHKPFIDFRISELSQPTTKWASSLFDIKTRLLSLEVPYFFLERMYFSFSDYFEGTITEAQYRKDKRKLTFEDYSAFRPSSIGSQIVLDYAQLASGKYLTELQFSQPFFAKVRHKAGVIIALTNDFFSAHKEFQEDESYNAALIFCRESSISREEGLLKLIQTHFFLMQELKELLFQLEESDNKIFFPYCMGIRNWIQGNYEWSSRVTRYCRWRSSNTLLDLIQKLDQK